MSQTKKTIIPLILSIVIIGIMYYVLIPPINIKSLDFWWFIIYCIVIVSVLFAVPRGLHLGFTFFDDLRTEGAQGAFMNAKDRHNEKKAAKKAGKKTERPKRNFLFYSFVAVVVIVLIMVVGSIASSPLFNARAYSSLVTVEDGDFATDISEVSMKSVPVVDKDTAVRLGSRTIGEISDLVSQYAIDESSTAYTQINYQDAPYRVSPLVYADIIKWFTNTMNGLPGFVTVNMATQKTELVRLPEGQYMHISTGEHFNNYLYRYVRFQYPTEMFGEASFELDDDGTPYWIVPILDKRIGLFGGDDYTGAILVNPCTGDTVRYELADVPSWVDKVFSADLVYGQLEYYGKYRGGFINAYIGQSGVQTPTGSSVPSLFSDSDDDSSSSSSSTASSTRGMYNYLAIDNDVYMYTGMTSANSDESLVGFTLVNLRTKETKYYVCAGATESSAMSSAEGQVQQMSYTATSPLLLNIADRPTYFLSLKDDAGLVKMYAFIDVEQYQIVGTGSTVDEAQKNYVTALSNDSQVELDHSVVVDAEIPQVEGTIDAIESVVADGNTRYYFKLEDDDAIYIATVSANSELPFLKAGDEVSLSYNEGDTTREVSTLEVK